MCIPYFARGFVLPNLVQLVDRRTYPENEYPVGQWDYWLYYREHFKASGTKVAANLRANLTFLWQRSKPIALDVPAFSATTRARGGLFEKLDTSAVSDADVSVPREDFDAIIDILGRTGLDGADAWYMNDDANFAFAKEAKDFGRLSLPVLYLHGAWDPVCVSVQGRLAEPMREDCADLTEVVIDAGHRISTESPAETNAAIDQWLGKARLR